MSYRLINSNAIAIKYPEVNEMPCIFADLPDGLHGQFIGWIPCSEQLPGWDVEVLVTTSAWRIHVATKCWGDGWLTEDSSFYDDDDIIAWMPLPAPYKREKTDD